MSNWELSESHVAELRSEFPGLARLVRARPAVFFDGPAGTQVPQRVIDAISHYLSHHNANHGGLFATSVDSDQLLDESRQAVADFLGADDPDTICFGANMTTLTFSVSRALANTWRPDDEIVLTHLEHDANFSPWVLAAEDAGVIVRYVDVDPNDCTLVLDDYTRLINSRTRLVAVGCASNAAGTINPVKQICRWAHEVGAVTFLDAVHYAPHDLIDVSDWDCDLLACSAYKFFGPHVGILYGKRALLESLRPYKLRPAPEQLPGRWMTGTQNHECIAGTRAAVDYLADVGRLVANQRELSRRDALVVAFAAIRRYERALLDQLMNGLSNIAGIRIWGITDPQEREHRFPTVSITHAKLTARQIASHFAESGIFVWHGNYYALPLTQRLGVEPDGMVRIGLAHYNTSAEVERLLATLATFVAAN